MARQTDRFYREIRKSHTIFSYVDVVSPDLETFRLPATDGGVDVDRSAAIRRKCSIKCVDPLGNLTPRANGEILTPYGTEIRPYRGVIFTNPDGTKEYEICPLGVFRLSQAQVDDTTSGSSTISLEAFDRSRTVARDKFATPYVVTPETNILTAIKAIIARTFPDAVYDAISTNMKTTAPLLFDASSDPWEAVSSMARSMGCEIYFDVEGRVAIVPPVDVNSLPAPDFTYIEGQGCTMTDLSRVYSDEPGFNGVIVTGESPGDELPPVRGEAWDETPSSPTYRKGPYGEVPEFVTDNMVKTNDEATAMAKALLAKRLGFSAQLSLTATVNPSYEAGDIIAVKRAKSGIDGVYSIDTFNVPLNKEGTQRITAREHRGA